MARTVHQLIQLTNAGIETNLSYGNEVQFFNEAYAYVKDGRQRPLINYGTGEGTYISPDFAYPLQIWHQLSSGPNVENDEGTGFGKSSFVWETWNITLYGFGNVNLLTSRDHESGSEIAYEVYNSIPMPLSSTGEVVLVGDINTNKHEVAEAVWGDNFKEISLEFVCFSIEYTIKQKQCPSNNDTPIILTGDEAMINTDTISGTYNLTWTTYYGFEEWNSQQMSGDWTFTKSGSKIGTKLIPFNTPGGFSITIPSGSDTQESFTSGSDIAAGDYNLWIAMTPGGTMKFNLIDSSKDYS